jgi:hypothetical protein
MALLEGELGPEPCSLAIRAPCRKEGQALRPEEARVGVRVRVEEHHRIAERRGLVGRVVGCYGGDDYVAVDVRFTDGRHRLFWPQDLEEISSPQPSWWRSLIGWGNAK